MTDAPGPTFLVAGAARSGSTAVIEALRSHPDVFVTTPKEPHYFALAGTTPTFTGPGDDQTINRVAVTSPDAYLALFAEAGTATARGDGSVSTLYYHERSVPLIAATNPQMRVVVVLREPVARAFSSFQYLSVRGFEPLDDFAAAVADEPRRRAAGWHHLWHYTAMSHYADSVEHFRHAFGDRLGVWFYDDLDAEPERTTREIMAFVGADPQKVVQAAPDRVNASGSPRRAGVHRALQWAARHESVRAGVKRVVPFQVRERIRNANLERKDVDASVRQAVAGVFDADLARLEQVLERPLPQGWGSGS